MALADGVSFQAASSGTGTFVFGSARNSFLTLAQAQSAGELTDGQTVSYLAQDSLTAPTQREWGHGTYSQAGNSVARTTVLGNSLGTTAKVNFSTAPYVSLTVLAEDITATSPGGSNTDIQYNSSGSFAGSANLTWNNSTQLLSITAGSIDTNAGGGVPITNPASDSGNASIAIGSSALAHQPSSAAYYSLAIGTSALNSTNMTTTAVQNIAIGYQAVGGFSNSLTSGTQNVALGYAALAANNSGSYNMAIGTSALTDNTSGNGNVAIGVSALQHNDTGGSNIGIGTNALSATKNYNSVAIGQGALASATGYAVTGVGQGVLADSVGGNYNVAIGFNTGRGITSGSANTIIGAQVTGLASGLTGAIILADGNGAIWLDYNNTTSGYWTLAAPPKLASYVTTGLPAGTLGAMACVTDGSSGLAWGATVTGGHSTKYLVWYNGSNWTVMGE